MSEIKVTSNPGSPREKVDVYYVTAVNVAAANMVRPGFDHKSAPRVDMGKFYTHEDAELHLEQLKGMHYFLRVERRHEYDDR